MNIEDLKEEIHKTLEQHNLPLNQKFALLQEKIKSYLRKDPVHSRIVVSVGNYSKEGSYEEFGVQRKFAGDLVDITIQKKYSKFLPIILLREAYLSFIPEKLLSKGYIHYFIEEILKIHFHNSELTAYHEEVEKLRIDDEFLTDFNRLSNFLMEQDRIPIFFNIVRRTGTALENFTYTDFLRSIISNSPEILFEVDILETIYTVIKIFYREKIFTSLSDFQHTFKEMTESGKLSTSLSLRNFISTLQFIKKTTYFTTSYKINFPLFNLNYLFFSIQVATPSIRVLRVLEKLLFKTNFYVTRYVHGIEGLISMKIPLLYLEDVKHFFADLRERGYITNIFIGKRVHSEYHVNLNFFNPSLQKMIIGVRTDPKYKKKYEMKFSLSFSPNLADGKVSALDVFIIDRINAFALTGIDLDKKEIIMEIKKDIFEYIIRQKASLENLKQLFKEIRSNNEMQKQIHTFFSMRKADNFFTLQQKIGKYLELSNTFKSFLKEQNLHSFSEFVQEYDKNDLEDLESIILVSQNKKLFLEIAYIYFHSKIEFQKIEKEYLILDRLFALFSQFHILSCEHINSILHDHTENLIFSKEEEKISRISELYHSRDLTSDKIIAKIKKYTQHSPPKIAPFSFNSIPAAFMTSYIPIMNIKDTLENRKKIKRICWRFHRASFHILDNYFTSTSFLHIVFFFKKLKREEKRDFLSILVNLFSEDIYIYKNYIFTGIYEGIPSTRFYDFRRKQFFYNPDLFKEYAQFVNENLPSLSPHSFKYPLTRKYMNVIWNVKGLNSIDTFAERVNSRMKEEKIEFNKVLLQEVTEFYQNYSFSSLRNNFQASFFRKYIHSFKVYPAYNHFGLSEYNLVFTSYNPDKLDLRLLLTNTFIDIELPCEIKSTLTMKIKYLFPFRNFNDSYLSWYTKSLQNMQYYCYFMVKKVYPLFHFNTNFSSEGWDLNANLFKDHIQKILFNPKFKSYKHSIKKFDIGNHCTEIYGPKSQEFQDLVKISPFDDQKITKRMILFEKERFHSLKNLHEKGLLCPLIVPKNVDLREKFCILIPDRNKIDVDLFLKIFHYFNYGFIYEIEGKYYEYPHKDSSFESGLYIELYLPTLNFFNLKKVLMDLFQYFDIEDYLFIDDFVPGDHLLGNLFNDFELEQYNPLLNLEWNETDKIWMNEKLFDEGFKAKYPDLRPKHDVENNKGKPKFRDLI